MIEQRRDPWYGIAAHTPARIGLGRAGGSVRSETLLDFRLAHARARDAVRLALDVQALEEQLSRARLDTQRFHTLARDRDDFLLRPDHGRTLDGSSRAALELQRGTWGSRDLVIVVSDGLSALAAEHHAPALVAALLPLLAPHAFTHYPIFVGPLARVKVADEVGEVLGAAISLILLGERPGLSSPDSLGAYLTFGPHHSRTDADRNCVSNIRPEGLSISVAARRLTALLVQARQRRLSGVTMKEGVGSSRGEPPPLDASPPRADPDRSDPDQ